MPKKGPKSNKTIKQDIDMIEHASRLRALPGGTWEAVRRILVWLAAGVILFTLGWLALSR
jgi:hypothetical protein